MYSVKIMILPGEKFDDLDTGKELLEKFGTLVGKNHDLLAETKHELYAFGLDRYDDSEDNQSSQSTWAQID